MRILTNQFVVGYLIISWINLTDIDPLSFKCDDEKFSSWPLVGMKCFSARLIHIAVTMTFNLQTTQNSEKGIKLRQDSILRGILIMLVAMGVLPLLDVCAKFLGQSGMLIPQIVWARMFFGAILIFPFVVKAEGVKGIIPDRPFFHLVRAAFLVSATGFFFGAIRYISIADSLAIFFIQPLIVTALSPIILKEIVGRVRWIAVAIGFVGTLVIIRPGLQEFNIGMGLALASGTSMAFYMLITRKFARDENPVITTFQTSAAGALLTSLALPMFWIDPNSKQLVLMLSLAAIAVFGHFLITRAYTLAEASLLAPLAYTEMIMSTFAGWWFFGDMPDHWTLFGVLILIGCAIFISFHEGKGRNHVIGDFEQP